MDEDDLDVAASDLVELNALDGWGDEDTLLPRMPPRPPMAGLAGVVAENIRYEAARYELSQEDLGRVVGKSRASISLRYTGRVAWTLDEVGKVAQLMGIAPAQLVTRASPVPGVRLG